MSITDPSAVLRQFKADHALIAPGGAIRIVWPNTTRVFACEEDLRIALADFDHRLNTPLPRGAAPAVAHSEGGS